MRSTVLRVIMAIGFLFVPPLAATAQQIQVVRSSGPGVWGANLRVVEELRIGLLDGPEEYTFGRVRGVAVGREGVIFVTDAQVPIIRMYSPDGRFIRNIGRAGEGPGEYNAIGGMRTFPDGRLALWDNRNRRINVYTPTGEYAESHRIEAGLFAADIFEVDPLGRFYVRAATNVTTSGFATGWLRIAPNGNIIDTLAIPIDSTRPESFLLTTPAGYDRPFTFDLVTKLSSEGYLITGRNDAYAFHLNRPDAPTLRIERPHTPVRVGREELGEWQAWARYFERGAAAPAPTLQPPNAITPPPQRASYSIPQTKPAFSEFRTDGQGRIWVRRYVDAERRPGPEREPGDERPRRMWQEPPTYDVFEPVGTFLGTVTLPWDAYFYDARDKHIWVAVQGEFGESYVLRLRIE